MKVKKIPKRSGAAFTLVEIMIVVAIIGLLAAIAIPNFLRARSTSQQDACIANLHEIDAAIQRWALENGAGPTTPVTASDIQPYMGRGTAGTLPWCPLDTTHSFGASYKLVDPSEPPVCQLAGGPGDPEYDPGYVHALPTGSD